MKKILLSILGLFFGLSTFCSSDNIFFNNYNGRLQQSISSINFSFQNISSDKLCISGFYANLRDGYLYESTFSSIFTGFSLSYSSGYCIYNFSSRYKCYLLSFDPICLNPLDVFSGVISPLAPLDQYGYVFSFMPPYQGYFSYGNVFSGSFSCSGSDVDSSYGNIFAGIEYDIASDSIFTVNYGNQSKEYTMTEDIDIFINSPVIKNGSTYIYDGSTGINLFYNNSSVFYDKNNLYLVGSFGYNNNVFTPVCL